jgi:hypothetical protein
MRERKTHVENQNEKNALTNQPILEEFSVVELEERLEFVSWCNGNCSDN